MKVTPEVISKAINVSQGKFEPFRRARGRFMQQYVGRFYGSRSFTGRDGSEERKASPLNLMYSAVTTLVPNLVYNDPKTKLSTDVVAYRNYSDELELATNYVVKKIDLKSTLRKVIVDAIFMAGFVKTGIADDGTYVESEGQDLQMGMPYAERVDPDDMILDPMARDWDEQTFIGNKFRVDVDTLVESGMYDADALLKLPDRYASTEGMGQAERVSSSTGQGSKYSEIGRFVDLVEVYLPREGIIVTMPYQRDVVQAKFLRVAPYEGPEKGPYHMLGFASVPDNLLPVAPAGIWYELHILGNRIARKLARQAERLKRVLAYQGKAQDDVNDIAEADDGETVRVDDIDAIKEVSFGGAATESYQWMDWVKQHFSEQAGNLEMLSGTGADTPTATQAQMLQANTSVRLGDMQNLVYQFTADVIQDIVCHIHSDPLIELPLARRVTATDPMTGLPSTQDVQGYYTPDNRKGDWLDFNVQVKPYSMAKPDPETSVRRKMEFATNVIPAAANAAAMLGPGFMVGPFLRRIANEVGIEDADEFLNDPSFQAWTMQRMAMNTGDPGKAAMGMGGMMPGAMQPQGVNPGQPNPGAYGPTGGVSPDTEQAQAQQETAGELQSSMAQPGGASLPSTRALAMMRP